MKKLSQILGSLASVPSELDKSILGLCLDSRAVKAGDLFFAYKGTHLDGRQFIEVAIKQGAVAIVAEAGDDTRKHYLQNAIPVFLIPNLHQHISDVAAAFYDYPVKQLRLMGITGTNGKTSCSTFLAQALQVLGTKCGVIGTLGKGLYGHVKPGSLTTPDAITLQKTFSEFVAEEATAVAMEVSSHSIDQGRINGIPYEVAIFTNLTQDHLDYHGDMQTYGAVKKRLFERELTKTAIINIDDAFGMQIYRELKDKKTVFPCSLDTKNKNLKHVVLAENISSSAVGMQATLTTPWGTGELTTRLVGEFNLSNVIAVAATLCAMGFPFHRVLQAVSELHSVQGRMQSFASNNGVLVIVDYAHTPDALEKVLATLAKHGKKRLLCLFGCGGDRDKGKRPLMAKIAERLADVIYVTDDNPRHESSEDIISEILKGFSSFEKVTVQPDRTRAIQEIIRSAQPGDCVLIAGRGGELYQQVGDEKIPFRDDEKVKKCLEELENSLL